MNPTIKLFIVDDHPFFRQGVRFYLETLGDIEIEGEADNGKMALEIISSLLQAGSLKVEDFVILMDLQMPKMNGIETTKALMKLDDQLKVLILTSQGDGEAIHEAMAMGAAGFCLKDAPPQELENAIRAVQGGGAYLGKGVLPQLLNLQETSREGNHGKSRNTADMRQGSEAAHGETHGMSQGTLSQNKEAAVKLASLTPREREVLVLLARGLSNKAIGQALFVSEKTVKTHVANLFGKLMVTSRTQAALWAQHQGLDREEI